VYARALRFVFGGAAHLCWSKSVWHLLMPCAVVHTNQPRLKNSILTNFTFVNSISSFRSNVLQMNVSHFSGRIGDRPTILQIPVHG
jgi:hypothetical protein